MAVKVDRIRFHLQRVQFVNRPRQVGIMHDLGVEDGQRRQHVGFRSVSTIVLHSAVEL